MGFTSVGVVGAGEPCREVAGLFARAGMQVTIVPWGRYDGLGELWTAPFRDRLSVSRNVGSLYGCDLVLEQVPGGLERQLEAIRTIEPHLSGGAILAVSTEQSPLPHVVRELGRPAQAVGVCFPRPLGAAEYVSLRTTEDTAPGVHQAMRQLLSAVGLPPADSIADAAE